MFSSPFVPLNKTIFHWLFSRKTILEAEFNVTQKLLEAILKHESEALIQLGKLAAENPKPFLQIYPIQHRLEKNVETVAWADIFQYIDWLF